MGGTPRLGCALHPGNTTDAVRRGILCRWSAAQHPKAKTFVLYRSVDGGRRETVFKGELDQTKYFDTAIRPGHRFRYVIVALDADGRVVGRGGPAVVGVPG